MAGRLAHDSITISTHRDRHGLDGSALGRSGCATVRTTRRVPQAEELELGRPVPAPGIVS